MKRATKLSYFITIPKISDDASLCVAEANQHIPFDVKRIYYILGAENGAHRGNHAHRKLNQVLFCIQGSITIVLDNGQTREEFVLDKPNQGVFMDNMMWREMKNFKKNTILLVLASEHYDERDYIREYDQFLYEANTDLITRLYHKIRKSVEDLSRNIPRVVYTHTI